MSVTKQFFLSVFAVVLLFNTSCQKPENETIHQEQNELVSDTSEDISKTSNPEKWLNQPNEDSYFVKNGYRIDEISQVNGLIHSFQIQRRDSQFVYAKDASRGMELRLPINKRNAYARAYWRVPSNSGYWNAWREFKYKTYTPEKWLNQPNEDSYFIRKGDKIDEISQVNGLIYSFKIQRRDSQFVYAKDASRGMELRLPINKRNTYARAYWRAPSSSSYWNAWREFKYIVY